MSDAVYITGIVLQALGGLVALAQVRRAPHKLPWLLIALSALLIVYRRAATLGEFIRADRALAAAELMTLVISLLFFVGVLLISRMFREALENQAALRKSEEQFRLITDNIGDVVWLRSAGNSRVIYVSPAYEQVWERTCMSLYDDPASFMQSVHPDDLESVESEYEKYMREGILNLEHRILKPDGRLAWVHARAYPVKDDSGNVACHVGLATDVTERKLAEEARQKSEAYHRSVVQTAMDGFWVIDLQGRLLQVNDAYCHMSGYTAEELTAMAVSDIDAMETPEETETHIRELITAGGVRFETKHRRKDGSVFDIEVSAKYYPLDGGRIVAFLRDITETKAAAEALRVSEAFLSQSQQIAHVGSWKLDLITEHLIWSDETYRILGLEPQEFAAGYDSFLGLIHPEDRAAVDEAYKGSLRENRDSYEIEHRIIRQDSGEIRYVLERCIHERNSEGEIIGSIGMIQDISERKRAEAELMKMNIELDLRVRERTANLELINRELDAFTYSVSHDLRAPLRRIRGFSEAVLDDYMEKLDLRGRGYLKRIALATETMNHLIEDLLKLSRVTRQDLALERVELSALARAHLHQLHDRDPGRLVQIIIDPGLEVTGDKALLRIALENLLDNAWKFTLGVKNARIEFNANRQDGQTIYCVSDNGAGFDMAYHDRLFKAFQRLHHESEYPGTGIGLSIVSRIISRHGGKVWAEGQPGRGAAFYFTLP